VPPPSSKHAKKALPSRVASRYLEAVSFQNLAIFDFDGTLFNSQEIEPEWWKDPQPYSWGMDPRSLDEPCVPGRPGSQFWNTRVVDAARDAAKDAGTFMVIITGRIKAHRPRIEELLKQRGITPNKLYFNPGMSAAVFKTRVFNVLLSGFNTIDHVDIWENENQSYYEAHIKKLSEALDRPIKLQMHRVSEKHVPVDCGPLDFPEQQVQPRVAAEEEEMKKALPMMKGSARKVASKYQMRKEASSAQDRSIALMKYLARETQRLGVARDTYVVGGAVRNFLIERPIKDIDVVIDSKAAGKDSEWLAKELQDAIPADTNLTTNQYGVAILTVKGDWDLDGNQMRGEVVEIANARKESYGGEEGKGYKPHMVEPSTIEEDVIRREFTFNTLMWRLLDLAQGPEKAEIIDLTGCGIRDLENRETQCPRDPDIVFADDPTRLLRAVKFVAKYGFKIPPDLGQAIKRNAPKMKQAPWNAIGTILVDNVLNEPTAKDALKLMKKLGLLEVIAEMVQEQQPFAAFLSGQLRNQKVDLLLDMMDLGLHVRSPISFLSRDQQLRLREITTPMPEGEAEEFLAHLQKPPLDNMTLIEKFSIPAKERGVLARTARELMLREPRLAYNPGLLQAAVEREMGKTYRRAAKKDQLPGGLADDAKANGVDPKELEMGVKVEMEHTEDPELAREIALDHLIGESPDYYTRLQKMEEDIKRDKKAAPEKYDHINFKPPEGVANAAKKGLEYRQKASPSNRGGLTTEEAAKEGIGSGVQRAVNLKNRDELSPETVKKMHGFFSRHEKNKGIAAEHKDEPWNDKGYVSWLLWGGDAGQSWASKVVDQMEKADRGAKKADADGNWKIKAARESALREVWFRLDAARVKTAGGDGDVTGDGKFVGLFIPLPESLAKQFPDLGENDSSPAHSTLLIVGDVPKEREADFLRVVSDTLAKEPGPIRAWLNGVDSFVHAEKERTVFYTPVKYSRDVAEIKDALWVALEEAGFEINDRFPLAYNSHTTLEYRDGMVHEHGYGKPVPSGAWEFDSVQVWGLPKLYDIPLGSFDVSQKRMKDARAQKLRTAWGFED